MDITLNLVSTLCWEIIARELIKLPTFDTEILYKVLLDSIYDLRPQYFDKNFRLYWRYAENRFLEITDHYSFAAFFNLRVEQELFLILEDAEKLYENMEAYLHILDLIDLKNVKEKERNKYELINEADQIQKEIEQCQESLQDSPAPESPRDQGQDDRGVLKFALRNMPIGRCYTADICSGYSIIDCVRKGWPKSKKILVAKPDEVLDRKVKKEKDKPDNSDKKDKKDKKSVKEEKSVKSEKSKKSKKSKQSKK